MKSKLIATIALGTLVLGNFTNGAAVLISSYAGVVAGLNNTWDITGSVTIPANTEVLFDKPTFVTAGGTLAVQEGAILRFVPAVTGVSSAAYLCVSADGTANITGSSTNPVIMTTAAAPDKSPQLDVNGPWWDSDPKNAPQPIDAADDINLWGGFILLGSAPINTGDVDLDDDGFSRPGYAKIEGVGSENTSRVFYGGENVNDNSGIVRYISIRYSGSVLAEGDEIQGLTLGGVGFGTTLEYIEVFGSGDDGIEVFGGMASFKYMVLSYFDDDGFDLDHGYVGLSQFGLVIASDAAGITADNLFEMDGDDDISADGFNVSVDGRPTTYAQIANFTLVGHSSMSGVGMRLRQGFGGDIFNTLVANLPGKGLRVDADGTVNTALAGYPDVNSQVRVAAGTLNIKSTSWYGVTTLGNSTLETDMINNVFASAPGCINNLNGALTDPAFGNNGTFGSITSTELNPVPFSGVVNSAIANPGNNFFAGVNYRGAFPRNTTAALWTNGWTALYKLNRLVGNGVNTL